MPLRVLHIIYSLFHGGAERVIETIALTSCGGRNEHLVCSLTSGGDLAREMERAGAKVFLLGKRFKGDLTVIPKLIKLIRRENIDLLHLHNSSGTLWGTLAAKLSGTGIPIVRTEHRPCVPGQIPSFYTMLYPFLSRRTSRIICVSESVKNSFVERFPDFRDRCVTILNGIHVDSFAKLPPQSECRAYFKLPPGGRLIGTVGRIVHVKCHDLLLKAFAHIKSHVPDAHLAILGEGDRRGHLTGLASDLGVGDALSLIETTTNVELFYGALDIFVLSSLSEGLPLTVLEALAAGVPAVSTAVGGIPEVIEHGKTGYMVPSGSRTELADRVKELLLDPGKAADMGRRGRERVRRKFTAERMVSEIEVLYEEVTAEKSDEPGT